jgi:PadR family transcriptional regulator PadR
VRIGKDLVAATATPLVLGILADGDSYGYGLLQRVKELSGGELEWTDGMLYPLLHRLERLGYVEAHWQAATGRPRKVYRLTDTGHGALVEQRLQWTVVTEALKKVWTDATTEASAPLRPSLGMA